jgi:hypothetical protein
VAAVLWAAVFFHPSYSVLPDRQEEFGTSKKIIYWKHKIDRLIREVRPLIGIIAISMVFAVSAHATMLIVVYTKDGFWLASDSYRSGGGKHSEDVCKIHETRFGLLAKSGDSQGSTETGEIYSTDKEIEDLLAANEDFDTFQSKLRMQFKHDIDQELALLVDDPTITSQNLEQSEMTVPIPEALIPVLTRSVIVFNTKKPEAPGTILKVEPQSEPVNSFIHRNAYKYWAPSTYGWHPVEYAGESAAPPKPATVLPPSIHEFAYVVSYSRTDEWVRKNPKSAITEILKQAHSEEPEMIGPPYVIVHVMLRKSKLPKVKWVSKGVCPGWSETLHPETALVHLRDEMRAQK